VEYALESGEARSLEDLGRAEGVTGRRIAQILLLLQLAPEIIEALDVPAADLPSGITERRLREVARLRGREEQRRAWRRMVGCGAQSVKQERAPSAKASSDHLYGSIPVVGGPAAHKEV
jgi:hypothetical protein